VVGFVSIEANLHQKIAQMQISAMLDDETYTEHTFTWDVSLIGEIFHTICENKRL